VELPSCRGKDVVEDHKHCVVCGKPVELDKFFCSPACEEMFKRSQKQAARARFLMLGMFIVFFVLLIILNVVRGTS